MAHTRKIKTLSLDADVVDAIAEEARAADRTFSAEVNRRLRDLFAIGQPKPHPAVKLAKRNRRAVA